jgi:GT2 family glycosyltransferase
VSADTGVTVVVVGFNDADSLPHCVAALAEDPVPARIVVVDNASTDRTPELLDDLEAIDERVETLRSGDNAGYAAAVDAVLPSVETEFLAVLNADTVPSPGWLAPQLAHLERSPDVAATSPTLTLGGGAELNAAGLDIHVTGLGFNRLLHHPVVEAGDRPVEVPGLQGSAFVIRTDVLRSAGGWYAGGFLYHEDAELSWTLRLMGYRIAYVPTPPVEHDYALTMSSKKLFLLERNRWEMLLANTTLRTRLRLAPLLAWTELMMWGYCLLGGGSMLAAKRRSYVAVRQRRALVTERRSAIEALRRVPDATVLGAMRWNYTWDQLLFLGRRRTIRGRRGGRDLPVR